MPFCDVEDRDFILCDVICHYCCFGILDVRLRPSVTWGLLKLAQSGAQLDILKLTLKNG